jgi:hypothetical protein
MGQETLMKSFYIIIGPDDGGCNAQYWDCTEWEWTPEFGKATRYDSHVFFMPLPPGAECIQEFTEDLKPIAEYQPGTPPTGVSLFAL